MKRKLVPIISILILITIVFGIIKLVGKYENKEEGKIKIVATLFPQYDFVKQIGKDKVEVELLLPSGIESHTYEPSPQDIININESKLFVYTGDNMEPWASKISKSIDSDTKILDVSKNINLIKSTDFEEEHENSEIVSDEETKEEHEYDPHIWLNPLYAIKMVENITDSLCEVDGENEEFYRKNEKEYIEELKKLDNDIENMIQNSERKEIVFGGTFSYAYFIDRYNLDFVSAYDSCGEGAEPSTAKVVSVIKYINNKNIPVVFYQELTNGNVAKSIAESTNTEALIFNSIHNAASDEIKNGATYISLMRENLENLKKALN